MPETARNAPCPCGSGKKYKLCCLAKNDPSFQLDSDRRRLVTTARSAPRTRRPRQRTSPSSHRTPPGYFIWDGDRLDKLSNGVVAHIRGGRFAEAEAGIARLREEYPEVIDWLDRSALLAEARGDNKTRSGLLPPLRRLHLRQRRIRRRQPSLDDRQESKNLTLTDHLPPPRPRDRCPDHDLGRPSAPLKHESQPGGRPPPADRDEPLSITDSVRQGQGTRHQGWWRCSGGRRRRPGW